MKPILVFAGPSLPPERLPLAAPIRLMPPARCGDMLRALQEQPAAMALVDGVFEVAPTVWHKEILAVIAAGVPVYGAASLGALRAAELDGLGMIGVGAIYQAYRDGEQESDAAVMVAHAPAELGHRPVTLALVDAEATLAAAALTPGEHTALCRLARRMNFRDRSWERMLAAYAERAGPLARARVEQAIAAIAFSQKQRDTALLLDRLANDDLVSGTVEVPRTLFLERLVNACAA